MRFNPISSKLDVLDAHELLLFSMCVCVECWGHRIPATTTIYGYPLTDRFFIGTSVFCELQVVSCFHMWDLRSLITSSLAPGHTAHRGVILSPVWVENPAFSTPLPLHLNDFLPSFHHSFLFLLFSSPLPLPPFSSPPPLLPSLLLLPLILLLFLLLFLYLFHLFLLLLLPFRKADVFSGLVTPALGWVTDLWWHSHSLFRSPHIRKYSQGANVLLCNTLGTSRSQFPTPGALIPQHIISCLLKWTPPTWPPKQCRLHPLAMWKLSCLFSPSFKNITYTRPEVSVKKCDISKMITPCNRHWLQALFTALGILSLKHWVINYRQAADKSWRRWGNSQISQTKCEGSPKGVILCNISLAGAGSVLPSEMESSALQEMQLWRCPHVLFWLPTLYSSA